MLNRVEIRKRKTKKRFVETNPFQNALRKTIRQLASQNQLS